MRASTLFVISIALFIGLGAAAGARYIGLFDKKAPLADAPREEPIMVLVANTDLYKGIAVTSNDVRVRELRPDERPFYEQNKGNLLPTVTSAVQLRIPLDRLRADQPLLRKHFQEDMPEPVSLRLDNGMRAVTVSVMKERSAGGVLQLGEYVDVWMTSRISDNSSPNGILRSACLARECRIIVKRNNLRTVLAADPDDKPLSFTLQANPYRAALIEFAQLKGQITLLPVHSEKMVALETRSRETGLPPSFSDMTSKEYRDEDLRVEAIRKGELSIGDVDLERIFGVRPGFDPTVKVVNIQGITPVTETIFGGKQQLPQSTGKTTAVPVPVSGGLQFLPPASPVSNGAGNKTGSSKSGL